jgi:hypothetical protein
MRLQQPGILRLAMMASVALLLAACAGSGANTPASEQQSCPGSQVLVCRGGTVSKTGRIRDREPRICECRPPERISY